MEVEMSCGCYIEVEIETYLDCAYDEWVESEPYVRSAHMKAPCYKHGGRDG